jgi:hypothetical protein
MYASNPAGSVIDQDFRKSRDDILAIMNFLPRQCMGSQDGLSVLELTVTSAGGSGFN